MNFEPQKFFIGLMDFFSILLPGGLMTFFVKDALGPVLLGQSSWDQLTGAQGWVGFLTASYLLGHFIFLLGAWLLDEHVYDRIRSATRRQQFQKLAEGGRPAWWLTMWMANRWISARSDHAVAQAVRLKGLYLDAVHAGAAINAFQWCKTRLLLEDREALAVVQRFEADSKFFRSLVVVLALLMPWGALCGRPALAYAGVPLLILALWRYLDQRVKATNQAYWTILTLEAARPASRDTRDKTGTDRMTHAGGVVLRRVWGRIEVLLVRATRAPHEWVLPKGHIEPGEQASVTAVREVFEETGTWARVMGDWGPVTLELPHAKPIRTAFYLMWAERTDPAPEARDPRWFDLDEALRLELYPDTRALLERADALRPEEIAALQRRAK